MKDKKLRIEDALSATKAAVEEGIVAGGGTALINAIPAVEALLETSEGDEKTGVKIVRKAIEEPVRQIAANAGLDLSLIHIYPRILPAFPNGSWRRSLHPAPHDGQSELIHARHPASRGKYRQPGRTAFQMFPGTPLVPDPEALG